MYKDTFPGLLVRGDKKKYERRRKPIAVKRDRLEKLNAHV